jgi:hypothetical protein
MRHRPRRILHQVGEPPACPHQRLGGVVTGDQNQDPLPCRPRSLDALSPHGPDQLVVDRLGGASQRHLAQGREVLGLEEVVGGETRGFGRIDLPSIEAFAQFLRRQVDQLDLVGPGQRPVGHGLAHPHAGDLPHDVDEALEMLDVQRRPHVDARRQDLLDILPALGVTRAGRVRMGVLVDQQQPWTARDGAVDVELHELMFAVLDRMARHHLHPVQQTFGFLAPMGLDDTDDHVDTVGLPPLAVGEHLEGLADARRHAEEDLQSSSPLPPGVRQQHVRIGAKRLVGGHQVLVWATG